MTNVSLSNDRVDDSGVMIPEDSTLADQLDELPVLVIAPGFENYLKPDFMETLTDCVLRAVKTAIQQNQE